MKKVLLVIFTLFLFLFVGCKEANSIDENDIISKALQKIDVDKTINSDIELLKYIEVEGYTVTLDWYSNNQAISTETGKVTQEELDVTVELTVNAKLNTTVQSKTYTVVVSGKGVDFDSILNELSIDSVIRGNITLPTDLTLAGKRVNIEWDIEKKSADERSNIDKNGIVTFPIEEDAIFSLTANVTYNNVTKQKSFDVTVISYRTLCVEAANKLNMPKTINDDIKLTTKIDDVNIEWYTSNSEILTKQGKCSYVSKAKTVTLGAGFSIDYEEKGETLTYYYDVDYRIEVQPYSFEKRISLIKETIKFSDKIYGKVILPTTFEYDLFGSWSSNNQSVIKDDGTVIGPDIDTTVKLELTIKDKLDENNESKLTFEVVVPTYLDNDEELDFYYHNIIDYTSLYTPSHLHNLKFNDQGKVVLDDNVLSGTYESRIFHTHTFKSLVGSWSCITSPDATIELEISVYTGGKWSNYFTYGVWGLGKTNTYYNQSDNNTNTKMSVDEIIVNNANANACKYRVTLKRNNVSTNSPVLSLVCLTIDITDSDYSYPVDISNLPKSVDNDLPKLYQYDVPNIGGSICSATTTTMLLKWKGYSFANMGKTYEHEYIASLVADPGHNSPTYGNWSYNMAVAGAYGDNAYVARMYSWEEVMYHLATVGPMGASIRSSNGEWGYNTNGHLVVVRGYRISDSGDVTVICNDPAVRNVYYEVTLRQFLQCWRGVSYVIEK